MLLLAKEQYKLKTVFSNYLSLGQFELARGIFQHLKRYKDSENLLDTLVILGPPKEWLYSISVPSSAHLAWLCCSLREELYGSENNVRAAHSNEGAAPNIAGPIPRWIIKQHELDILLTTALLDGAALQWQSLSPNTVSTVRRVFFKSLSRNIELDRIFAGNNVAEKGHLRATKHIFECATTVTNRLVALQFLPVPGFLPPIGSYLPEENIRMDSKIEILSPSVLHHFKH